jgi:hypothetical protein
MPVRHIRICCLSTATDLADVLASTLQEIGIESVIVVLSETRPPPESSRAGVSILLVGSGDSSTELRASVGWLRDLARFGRLLLVAPRGMADSLDLSISPETITYDTFNSRPDLREVKRPISRFINQRESLQSPSLTVAARRFYRDIFRNRWILITTVAGLSALYTVYAITPLVDRSSGYSGWWWFAPPALLMLLIAALVQRLYRTQLDLGEQSRDMMSLLREEVVDLQKGVARSTERMASFSAPLRQGKPEGGPSAGESDSSVGELSHSLQTPLSMIEAAALTLAEDVHDPDVWDAAKRIRTAVEVCNAYLAAFQAVGVHYNPQSKMSMSEALLAGFAVANRSGRLKAKIELPVGFPGYSNLLIVALLMPLVENAVEAAADESEVTLTYAETSEFSELHVRTVTDDPPRDDSIYFAGFSTKADHSGLGLSVTSRLVGTIRGASLRHISDEQSVVFTIRLPRRRDI